MSVPSNIELKFAKVSKSGTVVLVDFNYNSNPHEIFSNIKQSIALECLVDMSGSMTSHISNMRKSIIEYVKFLASGTPFLPEGIHIYLSLTLFGTSIKQVFPAEGGGYGVVSESTPIIIETNFPNHSMGSTYMNRALKYSQEHIWGKLPDNCSCTRIIMTDGQPNDQKPNASRTTTYLSHTVWAKEQLTTYFSGCADIVVGIGQGHQYDVNLLKTLSKTKGDPNIAITTDDILDVIRFSVFEAASQSMPSKLELTIPKDLVSTLPKSSSISWTDEGEYYQLSSSKVSIGFGVTSCLTLNEHMTDIPVTVTVSESNIDTLVHIEDVNYETQSRFKLFNHKLLLKEKKLLYQTDFPDDIAPELSVIKTIENEARIAKDDKDLTEEVRVEWLEVFNLTKTLASLLQQGDRYSTQIYMSSVPSVNVDEETSTRTYLMRTISSQPVRRHDVDRLVSHATKPVDYICCVCQDKMTKPLVMRCGHTLCPTCSSYCAKKQAGGAPCPMCRHENSINLADMKQPIYPADIDGYKRCLNAECQNRYGTYNYPCLHVTYCVKCAIQKSDIKEECPIEGCHCQMEHVVRIHNPLYQTVTSTYSE